MLYGIGISLRKFVIFAAKNIMNETNGKFKRTKETRRKMSDAEYKYWERRKNKIG